MEEQLRFRITTESELPKVISDLETLIRKQNDLGEENSRAIRTMNTNIQSHQAQYATLGNVVTGVRNMIGLAFGLDAVKDAISKIFDLTSTYQKYQAALTTGLGSQKLANESLEMLQRIADKSNFTLDELADTFTKFANRGLVLTKDEMTKLGDVANTLQKPFKDLGEAIMDINNTERWNELGIKAQTNGDKVSLTFKGVTKEVERTEKGVLSAIVAFGEMNGVQGATAAQALTLAGRYSTLQDSVAGLGRTIGNALTPTFEKAIDTGGDLIKTVAGSDSAFTRTVTYIKAIVAAWGTYEIAANASQIKTVALSAALAAKEVVMKGYNIVVGTSQIALQALTSATGANITITTAATTAARSFWAALAANPIGLIVTAIGVATSAYYAFKAAHTEVNIEIDAATQKLIKEKVELNAAVLAVQGYSQGTKQREEAVKSLMQKYPGLIDYIDADKVSNQQLNKALEQQIALLDSKIRYAAAAAQSDVVYNKQVEINKEQLEIIIKLRGAYKDLSEAYPDNDKFVAALKRKQEAEYSNAESMRNMSTAAMAASGSIVAFSGETAKYAELQKQSTALSKEMALATNELSKASSISTNAQVSDIQRQLSALEAAHNTKKVNDDDYKAKRTELLNEIKRLNGEEVEDNDKTQTKIADKRKEKKEANYFTAKELAVLTKEVEEESLKSRIDLIDANMKLEIEKINTHNNAKVQTEEQAKTAIQEIIKKAEADKEALIKESRVKIEAINLTHHSTTVELENKLTSDVQASEAQRILNSKLTAEERAKIEADKQAKIAEYNKKEQEVIKETEEIEKASHRERLKGIIGFLGEMSPQLAQFADFAIGVVDNIDIITGKSEQFYKKQAQDAETAMTTSKIFFGETSEQYNQAKLKSAEANKDLVEAQAKTSEVSMGMAMALADLVKQVFGMVSETVANSMEGILEGLNATSEAYQRFTDMSIDLNRQMIEITLKDTSLSFEEQKRMIDDFIKHENDTLYGNERMQNELNTAKNSVGLAKWQADRQSEFITNLVKGPEGIIANWKLVFTWRQEQAAKEEELARQQTIFEQNQAIQRANEQIATYRQMADEKIKMAEDVRDKQIEALETELEEFKRTKDEEIKKAEDNATKLKALAEQSTTDQVDNIALLDTVRNQLLEQWILRQVQELEDAKSRALTYAKTEEEKNNIIDYYNNLIKDRHVEYEDAKLDKTKAIKLATEQLKANEKASITKIQEDTTATVNKLKDDEKAKEVDIKDKILKINQDTAADIQRIQGETANLIRNANIEIFNANKQITIAELQGEIAKLKAKRWFLNAGRVDSAIATIEGVIAQIQGAQFGGGMSTGGAVDGDLGVNESYEQSGKKAEDIANQAQRAMETTTQILSSALSTTDWLNNLANEAKNSLNTINDAKAKAKEEAYAAGTSYVEGIGFPDGIDTVSAKLTKGERVVPEELNKMLGREVPNEALVKGFLNYKELQKKFGKLSIEAFSQLKYPNDALRTSTDLRGLEREVRALSQSLTDAIKSKPELSINVDANKVTVAEKSQYEQHTNYYSNIYNR